MPERPTDNLFRGLLPQLPGELVTVLAGNETVRVERIVSTGHISPSGFWYDQPEHEWVVVLQGEAELRFERDDRRVRMQPGDHLLIPAHTRHRVEWTTPDGPTVWLAVFYR